MSEFLPKKKSNRVENRIDINKAIEITIAYCGGNSVEKGEGDRRWELWKIVENSFGERKLSDRI